MTAPKKEYFSKFTGSKGQVSWSSYDDESDYKRSVERDDIFKQEPASPQEYAAMLFDQSLTLWKRDAVAAMKTIRSFISRACTVTSCQEEAMTPELVAELAATNRLSVEFLPRGDGSKKVDIWVNDFFYATEENYTDAMGRIQFEMNNY